MSAKKMGRPTESPKTKSVRVRMDDESIQKLDECVKITNSNRSEIIRKGIEKMHSDLNEKRQERISNRE